MVYSQIWLNLPVGMIASLAANRKTNPKTIPGKRRKTLRVMEGGRGQPTYQGE
jgi:hypothetical protein